MAVNLRPPTGTLPVNEVFGPTVQGEGQHAGRRCAFVRLGGCNLTCAACDTPQTWDRARFDVAQECPPVEVGEIVRRVRATGCGLVVVSGGEPLIWQARPEFTQLLMALAVRADVHVETNGTIWPGEGVRRWVKHVTVSPKVGLLMATDGYRARLRMTELVRWSKAAREGWASFKFVAATPADVAAAAWLAGEVGVFPGRVWIMGQGADDGGARTSARDTARAALSAGFNISPRLHLWLGMP